MDKLPCELTCIILQLLNLYQLIRSRLVCKKWRSIIDNEIKLKELIYINFSEVSPQVSRNYYDDFNLKYCLKLLLSNSLFIISKLTLFNRLEHLSIENIEVTSSINNFKHLKKLQIKAFSIIQYIKSLDLPNLEILSLVRIRSSSKIPLNTIKLKKLFIIDLDANYLEIKYPNSIKHLEIDNCYSINDFIRNLSNLETIFYRKNYPSDLKLNNNTKLKVINYAFQSDDLGIHMINIQLSFVSSLLHQKEALKRNNLSINYNGLKINTEKELNNFRNHISIFDTRYFSLLTTDFYWIEDVDYNKISTYLKHVGNLTTDQFFSKFTNIRFVSVLQPVDDQNSFVNFISNCHNLSSLTLINASIEQKFLNQLPFICPFITKIEISNAKRSSLKFLSNFQYLSDVKVNHQLNLETILKIFENSKLLYQIAFKNSKYGNKYFILRKHSRYSYCLKIFRKGFRSVILKTVFFYNLNILIEYFGKPNFMYNIYGLKNQKIIKNNRVAKRKSETCSKNADSQQTIKKFKSINT